ncbi:hypothetical protein [Streptomyces sp. NPDC001480]|uniref:hypothetical protein n=1 Tax=Streptomyces sp. NPDC001480 TaxID=3364577 RepID=UPI00368AA853
MNHYPIPYPGQPQPGRNEWMNVALFLAVLFTGVILVSVGHAGAATLAAVAYMCVRIFNRWNRRK